MAEIIQFLIKIHFQYFFDGGDTGLIRNLHLHHSPVTLDLLRKYETFGEAYYEEMKPADVYLTGVKRNILMRSHISP